MKLHHVGIAVDSLKGAIPVFEKLLGSGPVLTESVGEQGVRVAVFETGGTRIELLEAEGADSPVGRFIARRGPGIHHLTFAVPSLEKALEECAGSGIEPIDRTPRRGAGGERIAFLNPKCTSGALIELIEETEKLPRGDEAGKAR